MEKEPQKTLTEILSKLYTIPSAFPERESDEYDLGYQDALRECRHIIKEYLLSNLPSKEE